MGKVKIGGDIVSEGDTTVAAGDVKLAESPRAAPESRRLFLGAIATLITACAAALQRCGRDGELDRKTTNSTEENAREDR